MLCKLINSIFKLGRALLARIMVMLCEVESLQLLGKHIESKVICAALGPYEQNAIGAFF